MDYEKKYKEAQGWIEKIYPTLQHEQQMEAEAFFPELAESEDERIRKAIHIYLDWLDGRKDCQPKGDYTIKDMIAWLEKQGEQKPFDYENANIAQKDFAPKVEPKFKVKYAGSEYNILDVKDIAGVAFYGIDDAPNHIDYVKAENCEIISGYGIKENGSPYPTKPAVFSEQKPAWSEEDERICQCLIEDQENALDEVRNDKYGHSEIISDLKEMYRERIDWLKSLKDRYTWKPSDEQMEALKHYVDTTMDGDIDLLYQDLKELKGG